MKILHVFDHSLPHYDGYAFRSWEILRFERGLGIDTVQVTSSKHAGSVKALESAEGLDFHRTAVLGGIYTLPVLDQLGVVLGLRKRVLELIEQTRPDLIHAHSPSLNGLAALSAARRCGLPLVYEARSFWEDAAVDAGACREGDVRYRLTRASETHVIRRADHVVPICRGIAGDFIARGLASERCTVIPNAVDFARFSSQLDYDAELAARHGLTRGKTLGFAGSFFTFEGLGVLLEAMRRLVDLDPEVRLLLVGDGVERADLEAHVQRLGLGQHVLFTGRVPHASIESYYGIMDILVYPRLPMRLTELVTPLKPLEAMAYGKAVIASDVGGHRELIEHDRSGVLFKAGDAAALATSASALLADPARQASLRDYARRHVESRHNWASNVQAYHDIYSRLLS